MGSRKRFRVGGGNACLTGLLLLFVLHSPDTFLRQQPLHTVVARMLVKNLDDSSHSSEGGNYISVGTYFSPWSRPIKGSIKGKIRYFPNTCSMKNYFFLDSDMLPSGLEFFWIDPNSAAAEGSDSSPPPGAKETLPAKRESPAFLLFTLTREKEMLSSLVPPSPLPKHEHHLIHLPSSNINLSEVTADPPHEDTVEVVAISFTRRLAAVFVSPPPMFRPLLVNHMSPSLHSRAKGAPAAAAAAENAPTTAGNSAQNPGIASRRLAGPEDDTTPGRSDKEDDSVACVAVARATPGNDSAARRLVLSSIICGEGGGGTLEGGRRGKLIFSNEEEKRASLLKLEGGTGDFVSGLLALPVVGSYASVPATGESETTPSEFQEQHDASSPGAAAASDCATGACPESSPKTLGGVTGFWKRFSPFAEGREPASSVGAVVLHGSHQGKTPPQRRRDGSLLRWEAIGALGEAVDEIYREGLLTGNRIYDWFQPWRFLSRMLPLISFSRTPEGASASIAAPTTTATTSLVDGGSGGGRAAAVEALVGSFEDSDDTAALFDEKEKESEQHAAARRREEKRRPAAGMDQVPLSQATSGEDAPASTGALRDLLPVGTHEKPLFFFGRSSRAGDGGGYSQPEIEEAEAMINEKGLRKKHSRRGGRQSRRKRMFRPGTSGEVVDPMSTLAGGQKGDVAVKRRNHQATVPEKEEVGAGGAVGEGSLQTKKTHLNRRGESEKDRKGRQETTQKTVEDERHSGDDARRAGIDVNAEEDKDVVEQPGARGGDGLDGFKRLEGETREVRSEKLEIGKFEDEPIANPGAEAVARVGEESVADAQTETVERSKSLSNENGEEKDEDLSFLLRRLSLNSSASTADSSVDGTPGGAGYVPGRVVRRLMTTAAAADDMRKENAAGGEANEEEERGKNNMRGGKGGDMGDTRTWVPRDEPEFWLFDQCTDAEAVRQLVVAAGSIGVSAVIFTDIDFEVKSSKGQTSADKEAAVYGHGYFDGADASKNSDGTIPSAAAVAITARRRQANAPTRRLPQVADVNMLVASTAVHRAADLLSHELGKDAVASKNLEDQVPGSGGDDYDIFPVNSFSFSSSVLNTAALPVLSIPDTQFTRDMKQRISQGHHEEVILDMLPADFVDCRLFKAATTGSLIVMSPWLLLIVALLYVIYGTRFRSGSMNPIHRLLILPVVAKAASLVAATVLYSVCPDYASTFTQHVVTAYLCFNILFHSLLYCILMLLALGIVLTNVCVSKLEIIGFTSIGVAAHPVIAFYQLMEIQMLPLLIFFYALVATAVTFSVLNTRRRLQAPLLFAQLARLSQREQILELKLKIYQYYACAVIIFFAVMAVEKIVFLLLLRRLDISDVVVAAIEWVFMVALAFIFRKRDSVPELFIPEADMQPGGILPMYTAGPLFNEAGKLCASAGKDGEQPEENTSGSTQHRNEYAASCASTTASESAATAAERRGFAVCLNDISRASFRKKQSTTPDLPATGTNQLRKVDTTYPVLIVNPTAEEETKAVLDQTQEDSNYSPHVLHNVAVGLLVAEAGQDAEQEASNATGESPPAAPPATEEPKRKRTSVWQSSKILKGTRKQGIPVGVILKQEIVFVDNEVIERFSYINILKKVAIGIAEKASEEASIKNLLIQTSDG